MGHARTTANWIASDADEPARRIPCARPAPSRSGLDRLGERAPGNRAAGLHGPSDPHASAVGYAEIRRVSSPVPQRTFVAVGAFRDGSWAFLPTLSAIRRGLEDSHGELCGPCWVGAGQGPSLIPIRCPVPSSTSTEDWRNSWGLRIAPPIDLSIPTSTEEVVSNNRSSVEVRLSSVAYGHRFVGRPLAAAIRRLSGSARRLTNAPARI